MNSHEIRTRNEAVAATQEIKYCLMLPVHGRAITSEEIEIGIGREFGDPRTFPSLCNSLTWAYAKSASASLPSFTERVNVADLGIDAEWETELPANHDSPLLGPGWNVFQYKQHDVSAQGRGRAFSRLKEGLKGAVEDLYERTGRRPERYVLFTNLDLGHSSGGQKGQLRGSVNRRVAYVSRHDGKAI